MVYSKQKNIKGRPLMKTKVLVAIVILTLGQFKIADAQSSSVTDGRDLYVRECGDCHS